MSSELPKSTGAPAHQNVTFPSAGGPLTAISRCRRPGAGRA